jgi:phage-related protein
MSFLYDRDQNVTGTIPSSLTFAPSYGTQVSFSSEIAEYTTIDNYLYTMPKAVNHLQMTISMPFENRKQEDARKIAGFFESLHGTGYFLYTDPAQIYKPINLFLNSLDNSYNENDLHTINATLSTDQISTILNWSQPLITGSTIKGDWTTSTSYQKYDVVRYTGNATFPSNTGNLYDSFYYCKESHTSQSSVTPASVDTIKWSKDFFFQPTYSTPLSKETAVIKTELPYSFTKRTNFGLHANALKSFRLDFKGVSDAEARCILHFLIGRQGYRRFQYKIPTIYNQFKIFYAPQWTHTFVYKNVNDISVTLIEDPLGRVSEDITSISTNGLMCYLDPSNTASYRSGSTVYDLSGSINSGTLYNGVVFSSRNRGIFSFDGTDDYVGVASPSNKFAWNPTSTSTLNSISIEIWVKTTDTVGRIISKPWNANGGYNYWVDNSGFGVTPGTSSYTLACTSFATGNWEHFVYIATPTQLSVYRRGVLNAGPVNHGLSESPPANNSNLSVGVMTLFPYEGSFNFPNYSITGELGAFRIYNRALTQQEILTNFNAGKDRFKIQ